MILIFIACLTLMFAQTPLYFLSLEHEKLARKYGKEKGRRIGAFLGRLSGWGFFTLWLGVWVAPQPALPVSLGPWDVSFLYFHTNWAFIIAAAPLFAISCWLGIKGVAETSLETAETHRAARVVSTGLYGRMRHPQYAAGLVAHIAVSLALSAFLSLLAFPLVAFLVWLLSWKEERELIREFGDEYREYRKKVPMFFPVRFGRKTPPARRV
jgi:protein-S-isoprenylcysteine O-methyltransferase Ste14